MVLKKGDTLYERDSEGNLIPQEWELEIDLDDDNQLMLKGETIVAIPIPRGDIKKIFSQLGNKDEKDIDGDIVKQYCVEPKYLPEELPHIKPHMLSAIVNTILVNSGLDTSGGKKSGMNKAEDEFAKN